MGRAGVGLFAGLAVLGAAAGWFLGWAVLGLRGAPFTAAGTAIVGLVLAWALRATRPRPVEVEEDPMPPVERAGRRTHSRAASPRASSVRVRKSGPARDKGGDAR